jgi:hypothetical protein
MFVGHNHRIVQGHSWFHGAGLLRRPKVAQGGCVRIIMSRPAAGVSCTVESAEHTGALYAATHIFVEVPSSNIVVMKSEEAF